MRMENNGHIGIMITFWALFLHTYNIISFRSWFFFFVSNAQFGIRISFCFVSTFPFKVSCTQKLWPILFMYVHIIAQLCIPKLVRKWFFDVCTIRWCLACFLRVMLESKGKMPNFKMSPKFDGMIRKFDFIKLRRWTNFMSNKIQFSCFSKSIENLSMHSIRS